MPILAFLLSGGAAAPLAKLAGTCGDRFVGIRLGDKLIHAAGPAITVRMAGYTTEVAWWQPGGASS